MTERPAHQVSTEPDGETPPGSLEDRLRAEAVRLLERESGSPLDEPDASQAALREGGDFEARLLTRARHLSIAPELDRALRQLRSGVAWAVAAGLVAALLLGAATARATMGGVEGTRINFYWVLGGVLGVQTLLLLVWLGVAAGWGLGRKGDQGESPMLISLGRLVMGLGRWVAERLHTGAAARTVAHAAGRIFGTGRLGFWTVSSITHGIWLAFNVGALTLLLLLLSARQYTFVWETTILSEEHYVAATQALNVPAAALGFAVPTDEDIVQSQWTGESLEAPGPQDEDPAGRSQRWASLLVGSILLYGLATRAILLALALGLRARASRAFRLETGLPEYERLRPILVPTTQRIGIVDPDAADPAHSGASHHRGTPSRTTARPAGPPAVVGIEIAPPATGWPPALGGVAMDDLGIVESREQRVRVVELLETAEREPRTLVIVCGLTGTPDRGVARVVESLRAAVARPPLLLLTAGHSLRERGYGAEEVRRRVEDWRALAVGAGVEPDSVVAADLDHLTDAMAIRLAERITGEARQENGDGSGIEDAFELIAKRVRRWEARGEVPSEAQRLELHREIAALYRDAPRAFRSFLGLSPDRPGTTPEDVRTGASRFVDLLPPNLRASRRWLAAGAAAGAFGCLATAALAGPAAVAALPSWSAVGAAVAAALRGSADDDGSPDADALVDSPDLSDAVRAVALFTVTLELQGHDEPAITRVLDQVFGADAADPASPSQGPVDATSASRWLGEVRRRFDAALAEEALP